jgi:hypothetical protein
MHDPAEKAGFFVVELYGRIPDIILAQGTGRNEKID